MVLHRHYFFVALVVILTVTSSYSKSCETVSDCDADHVCSPAKECEAKSLWNKFGWLDATAMALIFIGSAVASGGGVGGGGVFIPILILVGGMKPKQAIPISQAIIFGGALVNLAFNVRSRNPINPKKPVIDYTVIMMFTPMLLAGTIIGVLLNVILPTWAITALLFVIMIYIAKRTTMKAIQQWKRENMRRLSADEILHDAQSDVGCSADPVLSEDTSSHFESIMICVIWLVVVAFSVLRSGKSGEPSIIGVRSYSLTYWVLTIGGIFTLSILTWILSSNLNKRIQAKLATGWIPNSSEVIWTNPNSGVYPIFAALAGLIGGLLGIGGGMVLAPLLIELGFHDLVVSATSATAVLLTSSSALTQYIILDMLLPSYSIVYLSVGIAATASGQITFSYLVAKYNRTSFLVGSIAIMIIVSTILLGISGIINTIEDYKTGNMGITKPW